MSRKSAMAKRRRRKLKKKRRSAPKIRNEVALAAIFHSGELTHPGKRQRDSKKCRGRIRIDDEVD